MKTIINVQSHNNLGDNIINFIFFKQIKEYIESNNIIIYYRCKEQFHKNLSDFNYSKNIIDYRDKFLKQININMNDFMNNKYTNQQINKLLYLLNNEIVKS